MAIADCWRNRITLDQGDYAGDSFEVGVVKIGSVVSHGAIY